MESVMQSMQEILAFIVSCLNSIFNLYTGQIVLAIVPALWLMRKIVKIYRYL